ncbi:YfhO family protein [Bacillus sp. XF8]|uniref:YfhO family protein n=1 Tax=Bacillus sp. XF8 TaxID=2819289 RepID=UPI001AA0193B|nr:YfhO family protein [Bacillus sp. XF8]MBO1582025.1 YfhO family protein [Bacillus sp. XF8]
MNVEPNNRKWITKSTLIVIPLLIACAFIFHFFFLESDNAFSSTGDALTQFGFFTFLIQHAFKDGNLFWSFNYGLGGDLFKEFSYYYSTAPFFWITLLLPKLNLEQIFDLKLYMSIIKNFLAMLFMYVSLRYHKKTAFSSFIASIIYGGCITFIRHSLLWDFMADAIVFLPLVIWGLDKYIIEKKKGLFLFATACMLASNFYFAFMISIFIYIYAFFQYFATQQNKSIKSFVTYYIRIALLYALSLGLAAFCFIPSVNGVLSADRLSKKFHIPLFFEDSFYKNVVESIFFIHDPEYQLALPVFLLFLGFMGLFIREKTIFNKVLFTIFMFILYLLPYTYSVFNGFSAMQSRWFFLFVFVIAQAIAYILDWLLSHKSKFIYVLTTIVLASGTFIYGFNHKLNVNGKAFTKIDYITMGVIVASIIMLSIWRFVPKKFIQFLIALNILFNLAIVNYAYSDKSLGEYFGQARVTKETLHASGYDNKEEIAAIRYIQNQDKDFYRVINPNSVHNTPFVQEYHGTSTYQSLVDFYVHDFMKNKYNVMQKTDTPSMFFQLDNRLFLENMLGVKYYVMGADVTPENIPYGYKLLKQVGTHNIYENENALPLGVVYDSAISEEEFSKLNFAQRDQLLLDAVVVNNAKNYSLAHFDTNKLDSKSLPIHHDQIKWENIEKNGDILTVHENGRMIVPVDSSNVLGDYLVELKIKDVNKNTFTVNINGKSMVKGHEDGAYSYPLERFVYNLGKNNHPSELTISIDPGEYSLQDLQVNVTNYQNMKEKVTALKENRLQNIYIKNNYLKGDINSKKDGLLYLSVPYSKGWSVKVDGKEASFVKANSSFIGIPIQKGSHTIEMTYVTPYFKLGVIISITSLIICILLMVFEKKRRQKSSQ